jgi:hypothetical protein
MMKKIIAILFCVLMLVACTSQQNKNEEALINNIKALENKTEVVLNNITPFEWDVVYSFTPYTTKEMIQEAIGFEANVGETVNECMPHLVFVKDKEIVCEILGYTSNLGIDVDTFSNSISADDNAVFKVKINDDIISLSEKTTDLTEDEIWKVIENKEWSTLEGAWSLGYGIYFYTENNTKYAFTMTYGSGLPVIGSYRSEARIKGNMIYFDFPKYLTEEQEISDESIGIVLEYKENILKFGDIKLKFDPGNPTFSYDYWVKMNKKEKN